MLAYYGKHTVYYLIYWLIYWLTPTVFGGRIWIYRLTVKNTPTAPYREMRRILPSWLLTV